MNNLGKPRNEHLWEVGSKLVENTKQEHPYFWVIYKIDKENGRVWLDAHVGSDGIFTDRFNHSFYIKSLTNLSLDENRVKNTELARFMYPEGKEDGEWLILEL
jgi:hypothetical protein